MIQKKISPIFIYIISFIFLSVASYYFLFFEQISIKSEIFSEIRFPRWLLALVIGGSLASCGAIVQAVFQNALAEPYTLGVASAAQLGVSVGIFLSSGSFLFHNSISFLFCMLHVFFLWFFLVKKNRTTLEAVIIGILISFLYQAIHSLLINHLSPNQWFFFFLKSMGHIPILSSIELFLVTFSCIFFNFILWIFWKKLDLLLAGEEAALSAGLSLIQLRSIVFVLTSILVSITVTYCGIIGFVGLIVPHGLRRMGIRSFKQLIPLSFINGASILILSDVLSRSAFSADLPLSVTTALVGVPLFLFIFLRDSSKI